jgi:hypothetical protein
MTDYADLLDAAADKLETTGWVQGTLGDERKGYCALGTIEATVDEMADARRGTTRSLTRREAIAIENRLTLLLHGEIDFDDHEVLFEEGLADVAGEDVANWNDETGRTKFEVIDAFRHAAKRARS